MEGKGEMKPHCNLDPLHVKGRLFLSYFHNGTGYSDPPHQCVGSKITEVLLIINSGLFPSGLLPGKYVRLRDSVWKYSCRRNSPGRFPLHTRKAPCSRRGPGRSRDGEVLLPPECPSARVADVGSKEEE